MKNTAKELRIVHRGVAQLHNGESAQVGVASTLLNMRERENALEVVGMPHQVDTLEPGDKVLLVDDDRTLVLRGSTVIWNGTEVLDASATVTAAHRVGPMLVVVTSEGNVMLKRTATSYVLIDPASALPQVHLAAVEHVTQSTTMPSFTFASPYVAWQAPLASDDVDALSKLVRNAMTTMQRSATSQGRFTGVILARYAVRLWDDSYLWMSQPVIVGHDMISSSYRSTATVTTSGNQFVGVDAFSLDMNSYRLGITMASGIASEWRDLVKAIDVLVSPQASLIDFHSGLDYRCVVTTSSGTRRYLLEVGPKPQSASAMMQTLVTGDWHVVASTSCLDGSSFAAVNTAMSSQQAIPGIRCDAVTAQLLSPRQVSRQQCSMVMESLTHKAVAQVSMEHNGRLYQAPCAFQVENPWQVLPWLEGNLSSSSSTATVQVTLATSDGTITVTKSGACHTGATALNPMIAFPDVRATHIAIAVDNKVWECDLAPIDGTDMAAYINPSLHSNTLSTGTLPASDSGSVATVSQGLMVVSAVGNPLVRQWSAEVSGCSIKAMGAACRPIYSGGFGRYPIYLFTNQGIMALPQSSNGVYGEPRLITQVVIAGNCSPVAGGDALWFVSQHGILCSITGSTIKRWLSLVNMSLRNSSGSSDSSDSSESSESGESGDSTMRSPLSPLSPLPSLLQSPLFPLPSAQIQLSWNDREHELWISSDDTVTVLMPSGRTYRRDISAGNLYSDSANSMAVTTDGALLDLSQEDDGVLNVYYLSHPIEIDYIMRKAIKRITWNLFTPQGVNGLFAFRLSLRGERGSSCHGFIISQVSATGTVAAPLSRPVINIPSRTMRLEVDATLPSQSLLLPTTINTSSPRNSH